MVLLIIVDLLEYVNEHMSTFISCLTKPLTTTFMMVAIAQLGISFEERTRLLAEIRCFAVWLMKPGSSLPFAVIKALTAKGTLPLRHGTPS